VPLRVIRDIRMEAHLAGIRGMRRLSKAVRQDERRLRTLRDVRLHFGCGGRILDGWVNIDGWTSPGIDFVTDLRQPLPLADGSCQAIFTEHVFEHIDIDARQNVLKELRRVLSPSGVLRIVVPDVRLFVDAYLREDMDWFDRAGYGNATTPAAGLNGVFQDHFHRFVDDFGSLAAALKDAGFTRVEESSLNASEHPALRVDSVEESRTLSSLYVEARP